jgi:hypothetical protein
MATNSRLSHSDRTDADSLTTPVLAQQPRLLHSAFKDRVLGQADARLRMWPVRLVSSSVRAQTQSSYCFDNAITNIIAETIILIMVSIIITITNAIG